MNNIKFNNIIKQINNIWLSKYIKTDSKNMLKNVKNLIRDINNIPGISATKVGDGVQVNYKDFDNDDEFLFEYKILIRIGDLNLDGRIRLIPTREYGYHIALQIKKDEILESENKFSIKSFIKELKQCETFEDVKHTFKKYAVEAITIGTLMTAVLCNFSLSDQQIIELGNINNITQETPFYIYDEDEEIKPEWKLLCNDSEITVYHAKESQCNSDIQHTASMFKLNLKDPESHKIVAMERTMMKQYGLHYGDLIKIEGTNSRDGVYQIQDTMNKRFAGKHKIDILINNDSKIGKWNNVKIFKLDNPEYFYNDFKNGMANALNQTLINRRQKQY